MGTRRGGQAALRATLVIGSVILGITGPVHAQHPPALQLHNRARGAGPVALESLALTNADNVVVIPPGNSANSNGTAITHGLQFSGNASVTIGLNRYVELDGTLYGDDNGDSATATFTIYDASSGSDGRPLFKYTFATGREIIPINISVRGLTAVSLETTYGNGALIDLTATVAPTGHVPPFPPPPVGSTPPLEALPLANADNVVAIPPGNSAGSNGTAITHGLQFSGNSSGQIALGQAYSQLRGTLYGDDAGDSGTATFSVYDASSGADGRLLYKYTFATSKDIVPINISVRGLKAISLETTYGNGSLIDLVATVTRAAPATGHPHTSPHRATRPAAHHAPPKRPHGR